MRSMLLALLFVCSCVTAEASESFDSTATGTLPKGWKTGSTKPEKGTVVWKIAADAKAASPANVLKIEEIKNNPGSTFNLCWTSDIQFKDGELSLKVRGDSGEGDQGGGVMWRVKDENNYYVARYNPVEHNFRVYSIKDGTRSKALASAEKLEVATGEWFTINVVHKGDKIECSLNGKKLLEATDAALPDAGGVGVWTKADAATSFDDLKVSAAK